MGNKKPLTDHRRNKLNQTYKLLKERNEQNPLTKRELQNVLKCDERVARDLISEVARKYPIISLSSGKGYFMLPEYKALADCYSYIATYTAIRDHAVAELESRMTELQKRIEPLKAWGF